MAIVAKARKAPCAYLMAWTGSLREERKRRPGLVTLPTIGADGSHSREGEKDTVEIPHAGKEVVSRRQCGVKEPGC